MSKISKNFAFTLAEVLIVIGVIGVVAAITIPTLIPLIKNKVTKNHMEVIEDRLIQGFNQLNTLDDGFNASQYKTTKQFVEALSKHYKISAICGANEITRCIPYENVSWVEFDENNNEVNSGSVEIATLTTIDKLRSGENVSDEWLPPASFLNAQGTPFIISLKRDCIMDTGKAMREFPSSCIALLYDQNGSNAPNRVGKDIITKGLTVLAPEQGLPTLATIGGVKIKTRAIAPTALKYSECVEEKNKNYGITKCNYDTDYWAGAMKICHDQSLRLLSADEIASIANDLYNTTVFSETTTVDSGLTLDTSKINQKDHPLYPLRTGNQALWSTKEIDAYKAARRYFYSTGSNFSEYYGNRDQEYNVYAVCVE